MSDPFHEIRAELDRAIAKFPTWPSDPLHALAVLGEEFGELTKALVQATYEPEKNGPDDVRKEAIQTAAMAVRFVMSLDNYYTQPGTPQHQQAPPGDRRYLDAAARAAREVHYEAGGEFEHAPFGCLAPVIQDLWRRRAKRILDAAAGTPAGGWPSE